MIDSNTQENNYVCEMAICIDVYEMIDKNYQ